MRDTDNGQPALWMGLLVAVAILFSLALACGMPFAALGALAALTLAPRDALLLAGLGWLANQAIGFGLMGYPLDPRTLAWGIALGLSALAAVVAAGVARRLARSGMRVPLALGAAVIGQQGTVFAASLVLGASASAFAPPVLWMILWTNTLAFALLLLAQAAGAWLGLARPVRLQAPT
ncbi:MAG: hypothetical protein JJU19_01865 [Pararhodobacter sp.]|nr:hypothetical protein [Pararhodobacter sp.]